MIPKREGGCASCEIRAAAFFGIADGGGGCKLILYSAMQSAIAQVMMAQRFESSGADLQSQLHETRAFVINRAQKRIAKMQPRRRCGGGSSTAACLFDICRCHSCRRRVNIGRQMRLSAAQKPPPRIFAVLSTARKRTNSPSRRYATNSPPAATIALPTCNLPAFNLRAAPLSKSAIISALRLFCTIRSVCR